MRTAATERSGVPKRTSASAGGTWNVDPGSVVGFRIQQQTLGAGATPLRSMANYLLSHRNPTASPQARAAS
jgi:hypothetical protein